jgi:dethiobiotin synthetase
MSGYFVAGSGTDVGKTWVTCGLLLSWRAQGLGVRAIKPLASGLPALDEPAFADSDTARLLAAQGSPCNATAVDACSPWRFRAALSPDMAAAVENRRIDFADVAAWTCAVVDATPAGARLLVEGVGGLMSPMAEGETNRDLAQALKLPVLLVCGSYLGAISHGLCALSALREARLEAAAVIVNESAGSPVGLTETAHAFTRFAGATPVRVLRRGEAAVPQAFGLP